MIESPLVFVHIPKTAGTSFRQGLERMAGCDRVCSDYGLESGVTNEIVRRWFYDHRDLWRFRRDFELRNYRFLTGHFHASRYAALFDISNIVTFLRDPVRRVVSEYRHSVIHNGYSECIETYYRSRENVNRQLQLLGGVPWPAIGFIGLTERYSESLGLLNTKFGLNVPFLEENLGQDSLEAHSALTTEQEQELRRLNAEEYAFYNRVSQQLDWRSRLAAQGEPFVSGSLQHEANGRLFGWAVAEQGDDPVIVRISVGHEIIADIPAVDDRGGLRGWGVPRRGYVGFSVDIADLPPNTRVDCSVATTGQPLVGSPWTRKEIG